MLWINHLSMQEMLEVANTMNRNVFSRRLFAGTRCARCSCFRARRGYCRVHGGGRREDQGGARLRCRARQDAAPECDQRHGEALLVRPPDRVVHGPYIHVLRLTADRQMQMPAIGALGQVQGNAETEECRCRPIPPSVLPPDGRHHSTRAPHPQRRARKGIITPGPHPLALVDPGRPGADRCPCR